MAEPVSEILSPEQIATDERFALTDVGADVHGGPTVTVALAPEIIAKHPPEIGRAHV